jgi:hypothetical protein
MPRHTHDQVSPTRSAVQATLGPFGKLPPYTAPADLLKVSSS